MKIIFSIVALLLFIIVAASLATAVENKQDAENTKKLSPCIWTRKLKLSPSKQNGEEYQKTIVDNLNQLYREVIQVERPNLVNKNTNNKIDSAAVIASILFVQKENEESKKKATVWFVDQMFPEEFEPLTPNFVADLFKRQQVVQTTCSAASALQLHLEVSFSDNNEDAVQQQQQQLVSLLHGKNLLKSPILYTVLPLPSFQQQEEQAELFKNNNNNLPFHQYQAEIHSLVLHNFFLGLRDLAPLIALDSPNCVQQMMLKNGGDKIGEAQKEAASDCMDLAFSTKLRKTTTLSSAMSGDRGAIIRKADSVSDVVFARDKVTSPKRVVFVVNDAIVFPYLSSVVKNNENNNEKEKETSTSSISSIILSAASEGRALFVWFRFDEDLTVPQERAALKERYGAQAPLPAAFTRVNFTLWSHFARAQKEPDTQSADGLLRLLLVLTDSRIDDGVYKFYGNYSLGISSQPNEKFENSPSQIYKKSSTATTSQLMEELMPDDDEEDSKDKKKNNNNNKMIKKNPFLLHPKTYFEAVRFIASYANPRRPLEPMFPEEFLGTITPFRTVALFFIRTMGYDKNYNSELASAFLKNPDLVFDDISKGSRTGGLFPLRRRPQHFDDNLEVDAFISLVPLVITNAILQADLASQFSLSAVVPCFTFFDRRDRRIITDRSRFQFHSVEAASDLSQAALELWRRAELDHTTITSAVQRHELLFDEATTVPGKVMQWIEEKIPYILSLRLWMRVDPEEMLLCIAALILTLIVVFVMVFLFHLVKLPESATFKDVVYGTPEEQKAAKEKIQKIANLRAAGADGKELVDAIHQVANEKKKDK